MTGTTLIRSITEGALHLAAVIAFFENKTHELTDEDYCQMTEESKDDIHCLFTIMLNLGVCECNNNLLLPVLSEEGKKLLACKDLLLYGKGTFKAHCNFRIGKINKTNPENYTTLRRGLRKFSEQYIGSEPFESCVKESLKDWMALGKTFCVVDIGCGDGHYSNAFSEWATTKYNGNIEHVLIDRKDCVDYSVIPEKVRKAFDFRLIDILGEEGDTFVSNNEKSADIIMLNELLHCMDGKEQVKLLQQCGKLLKDDGQIIVGENEESAEFTFRLRTFTHGSSLDIDEMIIPGFKKTKTHFAGDHIFVAFEKTNKENQK